MKKRILDIVKLLRVTQWLKNGFIFAPLIFSKHLFEPLYAAQTAIAIASFSIISSVVYIFNDIVDRKVDRLHPIKKNRPIASGDVPVPEAVVIGAILFGGLLFFVPLLNAHFWFTLALYGFINIAYSFWLKKIVLVDVFIIAAGFMLRVLAGVFAIDVEISSWLVLCTLFVSVFLAVSKRRGELILCISTDSYDARPVIRQYDITFIDQMMTVAATGMAISYALYTVAERTIHIFGTENLIFTTVFVLFGVFRYIFLIRNKKTEDNPMHLILSDPALIANIVLWFVSCVLIIYFKEISSWMR